MSKGTENAKILIVEDEVVIAADLTAILEKFGHTVTGKASNGKKALMLAEQLRPDLILMDIVLQGEMDGIEAAAIVRKKWNIPVVFLTAHADAEKLKRAKLTYPFGYILKPFKQRDLRVAIDMALYVKNVDNERRQAEIELKLKSDALEHSLNGFDIVGENGKFVYANRAYLDMWGYDSLDEILETSPISHCADPAVPARILGELKEKKECKIEFTARRKDGSFFEVLMYARLGHDEFGREIYSGTSIDITERKKSEEILRRSEALLNATQRLSKVGGWEWDVKNDMMFWSDEVYRIHEFDLEELEPGSEKHVARSLECYDPEDQPVILNAFRTCAEKGVPYDLQFPFTTAKGRRLWIRTTARPVYDEKGNISRVIGDIMDVTAQKKAEEEKEKLQDQLQQALKMEAIGRLAGGISHDFNNLLQVINGYCQILLLDVTRDDPQHANLKAIQDAGFRAAELVKQLLLFSRKLVLERKPIKLNNEVKKAHKVLERTIPKMIEIEIHSGSRLWEVNADPVQMEQILLNLGTNAADAMPDGGRLVIETQNITITEEYARNNIGANAGNYVLLTVSDNGCGMDKDVIEYIFEPFYTTKEIGQGTGLGLASVYGIVKGHGGYINCYSELGQGTVFKIYLPALPRTDTRESDPAVRAKPPRGGSETILLVDDETSVRELATQILERFGYKILAASSGEEALEIFSAQSKEIHLVVLDIGMPGMGGAKCLSEIIRLEPSAKVLIASGYSINGHLKTIIKDSAAGYVSKPYELYDLLEKVRTVLDGEE